MTRMLWFCLAVIAAFLLAPAEEAFANWKLTLLHSFSGADGSAPYADLVFDANGNLYGATSTGGVSNNGVVFKLTPPTPGHTAWTEDILYRFAGGADGSRPLGGVTFDAAGNLYGTTYLGGPNRAGTVYKLSPPAAGRSDWTETVLHGFGRGGDGGAYPQCRLVFDAAGNLYGTDNQKASAFGSVFKLAPPTAEKTTWTFSRLFSFSDVIGGRNPAASPEAGVIFDPAGNLYGTTLGILRADYLPGDVFKLAPPSAGQTKWTETVLHNFASDHFRGNSSSRLVRDAAGNLYGASFVSGIRFSCQGDYIVDGCGYIFKLTPPAAGQTAWTKVPIHRFDGWNGAHPQTGLVFDTAGNLYGTTVGGGRLYYGTAFKLTPPGPGGGVWPMTVLHSFNGPNGSGPHSELVFDAAGNLYGTTAGGGKYGMGVVFKLTP